MRTSKSFLRQSDVLCCRKPTPHRGISVEVVFAKLVIHRWPGFVAQAFLPYEHRPHLVRLAQRMQLDQLSSPFYSIRADSMVSSYEFAMQKPVAELGNIHMQISSCVDRMSIVQLGV
jgi:hypothetical protein